MDSDSDKENYFSLYENLDKLCRNVVTASINRYITRAQNRYGGIKGSL